VHSFHVASFHVGDQNLQRQELDNLLCGEFCLKLKPEQLEDGWTRMDADGDGLVTFEEFRDWWLEHGGLDFFKMHWDQHGSHSIKMALNQAEEELELAKVQCHEDKVMVTFAQSYLRREQRNGAKDAAQSTKKSPFIQLAFATGNQGMDRVRLSAVYIAKLRRSFNVMVGLFVIIQVGSLWLGYSCFMSLLYGDEAEQHALYMNHIMDMIQPRRDCVGRTTQQAFNLLCLLLVVPALVVFGVALPVWLQSLQLAAILAAEGIQDIATRLNPVFVEKLFVGPAGSTGDLQWNRMIQFPAANLVMTMEQLSGESVCDLQPVPRCCLAIVVGADGCALRVVPVLEWGPSMGIVTVICNLGALAMVPYCLQRRFWSQLSFCCLLQVIPLAVAYAPAQVSSACDDFLEQLNEVSYLGDVEHKIRCTCCQPRAFSVAQFRRHLLAHPTTN
jgi:hypothetical protein